jgi:hypothetical protein
MRLLALIPLACAITSLVLALLCILAGNSPNYLEDYHIVALNTSTLGRQLISQQINDATSSGNVAGYTIPKDVLSAVQGQLGNINTDQIANELSQRIGIKQWYSMHMLDVCEGNYSPSATASGAGYNASKCWAPQPMYDINIANIINNELQLGPLGQYLNLDNIAWPQGLTDGINTTNKFLDITFILYCVGAGLCALTILFSLIGFFLPRYYKPQHSSGDVFGARLNSFLGSVCTILSFLVLGVASALATVYIVKATSIINEKGNAIGVYAYKGDKFLALSWAATGVMLVGVCAWLLEACRRRSKRNQTTYVEKNTYVEREVSPVGMHHVPVTGDAAGPARPVGRTWRRWY